MQPTLEKPRCLAHSGMTCLPSASWASHGFPTKKSVYPFPDTQCMVYLPTFTIKKLPNVAKKEAHMEHLGLAEFGVFMGNSFPKHHLSESPNPPSNLHRIFDPPGGRELPAIAGLYASNPPRRPLPRTGGWTESFEREGEGFSEFFYRKCCVFLKKLRDKVIETSWKPWGFCSYTNRAYICLNWVGWNQVVHLGPPPCNVFLEGISGENT